MTYYKRLPLHGLTNARDLGGYPTKDGRVTKYRVFVRSELPRELTDSDIAFLKDYGITLSIDFRGNRELSDAPSCLRSAEWLRYYHNPLINLEAEKGSVGKAAPPPVERFLGIDWRVVYTGMADSSRDWVKTNMELVAAENGVSHYHCTTGKDRTGIFTAMLLGISGVSDEDIVADYCISQIHLRPVYQFMSRQLPGFIDDDGKPNMALSFFQTAPATMEHFLEHIYREYGTMREYVKSCGVSEATIDALVAKFVEDV